MHFNRDIQRAEAKTTEQRQQIAELKAKKHAATPIVGEPSDDNPTVSRSWAEFRQSGMLWWCNRALQMFGWAIVITELDTGAIIVEPRRTIWRGFPSDQDALGFERVTEWMHDHAEQLLYEVRR